jgi:hypothetical protein
VACALIRLKATATTAHFKMMITYNLSFQLRPSYCNLSWRLWINVGRRMPFKELRQIPHSAVMSSSCVSTASDGTGPSNEFPASYHPLRVLIASEQSRTATLNGPLSTLDVYLARTIVRCREHRHFTAYATQVATSFTGKVISQLHNNKRKWQARGLMRDRLIASPTTKRCSCRVSGDRDRPGYLSAFYRS